MTFLMSTKRSSSFTLACALIAASVATAAQTPVQSAQAAPQPSREQILEEHGTDEKAGSAAEGRPLYDKLCAGCHRFGGIGKDVGPDLTTLASRFKRRDTLEAILWPSKIISDQYQAEMFEMNDGKVVTGVIVRETATAALVRTGDNPDKPVVVTFAQVANRAPSTVSLMPEGLIDALSRKEIADLMAFVMAPPPDK